MCAVLPYLIIEKTEKLIEYCYINHCIVSGGTENPIMFAIILFFAMIIGVFIIGNDIKIVND